MSTASRKELAARLVGELHDLGATRACVTGAIARGADDDERADSAPGAGAGPIPLLAASDDEDALRDGLFDRYPDGKQSFDAFEAERNGIPFSVRVVPPERFGALSIRDTGNDRHLALLVKQAARFNLEIDESGIHHGGDLQDTPDEETAYRLLGLRVIPPAERIGTDEIERYERT